MPDAVVTVAEVKAFKTQSGKTRFVLRDDEGRGFTRPSASRSPRRGGSRVGRLQATASTASDASSPVASSSASTASR